MEYSLEIIRTVKFDKQTEGILYVLDDTGAIQFKCFTLELPDLNNQRRISCIPEGTYNLKLHNSPKFKQVYWVQDVPGRSEILIHSGNYVSQILGCILVGDNLIDINKDGLLDVTNSTKTMQQILKYKANKLTIKAI
jgi:hypothetical protein